MGSSVSLWGLQASAANGHSAVRILSPKEGEVLTINMVHCKYELIEPASADTNPTFELQLDDQDPVRTIITDHTFTGLKEGPHEIFAEVLDANNTPIPGTRAAVNFKVSLSQPRSAASHPHLLTAAKTKVQAGQSSSPTPEAAPNLSPKEELPDGGSPLPLLAVLCGGALAGGTFSVLRTRGRRTRR